MVPFQRIESLTQCFPNQINGGEYSILCMPYSCSAPIMLSVDEAIVYSYEHPAEEVRNKLLQALFLIEDEITCDIAD